MTFGQLRILLAVVDRAGFTAAAGHLGLTQPAVSRAVGALESELGTTLVVRGRDRVVLTEAGQRAVEQARTLLHCQERLRAEVAAAAGRVTGALRVASFPSTTASLVVPRLRAFCDRYPQVRTTLFEGADQDVRGWLDQGAADVAVVTLPTSGVETVPLAEDDMVAVLPAGHRLAARPSLPLSMLGEERFILSTGGCEPIISGAARSAGARLDVAFEAREVATVLAMVESGLGVSVVPALALPARPGEVVTRPLDPPVRRRLALAARSDASPAARAFLALELP